MYVYVCGCGCGCVCVCGGGGGGRGAGHLSVAEQSICILLQEWRFGINKICSCSLGVARGGFYIFVLFLVLLVCSMLSYIVITLLRKTDMATLLFFGL